MSGTVSILVGGFILAIFLALFNYLTPSGRVTVAGRVMEVTPNVTGQIIAIPVKANVRVKANDILFQIDPAPFQYKVTQLQPSLAAAKQQSEILKSNYEQAIANVAGLTAQVAFNTQRNADIQKLAAEAPTRHSRLRTARINTRRRWRSSTWPRRRSRAPSSHGFRNRRHQHVSRSDSGAI